MAFFEAGTSVSVQTRDTQTRNPRRTTPMDTIPSKLAITIAVAWAVAFFGGTALEPVPAVDTPAPWFVTLGSFVLLGAMALVGAGAATKRRFAVDASFVGASVMTAFSIACPASGHHQYGLWWFGQMTLMLGLLAFSGIAWIGTRRASNVR